MNTEAENLIRNGLAANDSRTVEALNEYLSDELCRMPVIELLTAIEEMPLIEWNAMLAAMNASTSKAMKELCFSLEEKRAAFIEHQAKAMTREAGAIAEVQAEILLEQNQ